MKKPIFFFLIYSFLVNSVVAQSVSPEVISAAGDRFEIPGYSVEWTLGEPAILTLESSGHQFTQGFHQPTYMLMTSVKSSNWNPGEVNIFPNPAQELVFADLKLSEISVLKISLMTIDGVILDNIEKTIQNGTLEFDLAKYPDGTYLLSIQTLDGKKQSSYIIQKINKQ